MIAVNGCGEVTGQIPFHTFYSPGTTKRENAAEITIRPGDNLQNIVLKAPETLEIVTDSELE